MMFIVLMLISSLSAEAQNENASGAGSKTEPIVLEENSDFEDANEETAEETAGENVAKTANPAVEEVKLTRLHRGTTEWTVLGNLSALDTWIPMKWGVSVSYNPDENASWELEYLRGKISYGVLVEDIGSISDQRFSLLRRSYSERNSFNFAYGIFYNSLEASLGSEYLATVSGNPRAYETVKVETLGVSWGMGNRWQTQGGFVWSFDWFLLNVPLVVLESEASFLKASTSESQKKDVRDILKFFEDYPTFAIVKIQLGMSF